MDYSFYITPEEYTEALENGICSTTLESRIRCLGWGKRKAIETPPHKKQKIDKKWVNIAEQNGICYSTLRYRVNRLGWDIKTAATIPLQDRSKQAKHANESCRKYPKEIVELAKQNGIHYDTFRRRVKNGWELIRAATQAPMTNSEIGRYVKEKYYVR